MTRNTLSAICSFVHGTQAKDRLGRWLWQHRDGVRFCSLFSLYTLLAFLLLYALDDLFVVPFARRIAWLTDKSLRAAGVQSWVASASVGIPGFAVEIKNNCNAIYEIGLYAAAVSSPTPRPPASDWLDCCLGARYSTW